MRHLLRRCIYLISAASPSRRGRPLERWEDRVKKYMSKRGVKGNGLEQARRECMDKERRKSFSHGHPPWRSLPKGAMR